MKKGFSTYIISISFTALILFNGCSATETTVEEKPAEKVEVSDRERLKSTVILIDAAKEKMLGNWSRAATFYLEALNTDPNNSAAAYELAKIHARGEHYDDALRFAKKAVDLDPENRFYLITLADIYVLKGQLEEAVKVHQRVANMNPDDLALHFDLVSTYIYLEKYDKALQIFDHIESLTGFSDELSMRKIQLFMETEMYEEAIKETKKLISAYPDELLYKDYLAEIYTEMGEDEKAIDIYREILEEDPENALARLQMAEHYRQKGDVNKSIEELKQAFKNPQLPVENKGRIMFTLYNLSEENPEYLDKTFELMDILVDMYPGEAEIYSMYGDFLFREEKYEQAREMFIKSAELEPGQYPVWEQVLYISSQLKDYEFMIEFSEKAFEYFFEQPTLYFFNGLAYFQLEKYKEAVEAFEYGVDLVVDNDRLKGQFYTLMGDSYYKLDEYEKSDRSYEKALEIDPENTFALNNYSYYLSLRNENLEHALEMSKKSNELEENNSAYQDTYGWIKYKMGDYEEAERWIKKAINNSGDESASVLEHYGDVLYKLGKSEEAVKYWEKAKEIGDGSEFLEKKLKHGTLYE